MSDGLLQVLAEGQQLRRGQAPVFLAVVAVHVVAGWALLSVDMVRDAVVDVVPAMVVTMLDTQLQPESYTPPPPASLPLQLTPLTALLPIQEQAAIPLAPIDAARYQPVETATITNGEATERLRESASLPRIIPASAVEYLVSPRPVYPLYSRRAREIGVVLLRVLINDKGLPAQVEVEKSSGYSRLDEAAVVAMRGARFKPYTERGVALAVWAPAPIVFEL